MQPGRSFAPVLLAVLAVTVPAAASAQSTSVPDDVEATYAVTFRALDDVTLTADVHVHRTLIGGEVYTADEIREEYARSVALGSQEEADAFVDAMLERVRAKAEQDLAAAFPDALSRTVTSVTLDRSSLSTRSTSPTIDLRITAIVRLDRDALGLGGYTDEHVDAVFRAGARLLTDVRLSADGGYRVTYLIDAPGALHWEDPNLALVTNGGRTLTAEVDNRGRAGRVVTDASAWLTHPDFEAATGEDVRTVVTYALPDLSITNGALDVDARVVAEIHALDLAARLPGTLPERLDLRFLTADGLRLLREQGVIAAADIAESEQVLLDELADAVGARFDGLTSLDGGFDRATLAATAPEDAPVTFTAEASAAYAPPAIAGLADGADLGALLAAGARLDAKLPLTAEPGSETTIVMRLPPGVVVEDAEDAVVDGTGRIVTWVLDNTGGATRLERSANLRFAGADAPTVTGPDATLDVVIDVKDVDVSVTQAAGGDFGRLLVDVAFTGSLKAMALPDDARAKLPEGLVLDHVSAHGLRTLVRERFLTEDDLASLEDAVLHEARTRLENALGVPVTLTGGLDRATLTLAAPGAADAEPVVFRAHTALAIPLAGDASGDGAPSTQALALTVLEKEYAFPPVPGLRTTYTLLLPPGIALQEVRADGGSVETGRDGGRDWIRVTPTEDAPARAVVAMGVTGTFMVMKFWPVLAAAGALVLLFGAGAALARRKRRRERGDSA